MPGLDNAIPAGGRIIEQEVRPNIKESLPAKKHQYELYAPFLKVLDLWIGTLPVPILWMGVW